MNTLGYKVSYIALGGTEAEYIRITSLPLPIEKYLDYDEKLVAVLNILMQNLPVHIFTGATRERVFNALEVLIGDLREQFADNKVLAVDDMRRGTKPDPEAYQEMIEHYAIKPTSTIYVDDQRPEVETAASLGMITFLIQQSSQGEKRLGPHILLNSLEDLLDHLKIN